MNKFLQFSIAVSLLLAGASLFIFSIQPAHAEHENTGIPEADTIHHLKVVYINIDSLNQNYLAFSELSKSAGENLDSLMFVYQEMTQSLQQRYDKLQTRVTLGTISTAEAELEENKINQGLDDLQLMETAISIIERGAMLQNDSISMDIALFLNDYSQSHHIDYVLMYGTGMPVIYANDAFDLTDVVLNQLNAEYLNKKKKDK